MALAKANAVLESMGLQIHYDTGMVPGLLGDAVPDFATAQHEDAVRQAQRVEQEEQQRQQDVAERIRQAEAAAAQRAKDNG